MFYLAAAALRDNGRLPAGCLFTQFHSVGMARHRLADMKQRAGGVSPESRIMNGQTPKESRPGGRMTRRRRNFSDAANSPAKRVKLEERRAARRFDVAWEIRVKGRDGAGAGFEEGGRLVNLSSRGAFLRLEKNCAVGRKLEVRIKVPSEHERWMAYSAEVVRLENSSPQAGIAVRFTRIRPRLTGIL
jgi:hypothetical protein